MGTVSKITKFVLAILMTITSINLSFVYADEPTTSNATEGESLPANNDDASNEEAVNSENTSESTDAVEGVQDEEIQSEGVSVENEVSTSIDSQAEVEATQAIAETAANDEGTTNESATTEETSEEKTVDTMSSDELFAYIMTLDADQLDALYDEYENLDDLMANFTEEQQAELANKFRNVEENIEVASDYSAYISANISNATVTYFKWHDSNDTKNVTFTEVTNGTNEITGYTTSNQAGYVLFFVKPSENHLINGLSASGDDDMFPIDTTKTDASQISTDPYKGKDGSAGISNYPGLTNVLAAAAKSGYVATFGYSRSAMSTLIQNFTIKGQQPTVSVSATSNKWNNVKPGDEITFTVTINPQVLSKTTVKNVAVNSASINGTKVEISELTGSTDGTWTGTVAYTATESDCASGKVTLFVYTETEYKASVSSTGAGSAITTNVTITNNAQAECDIAQKSQVKYQFTSKTSGKTLPSEVKKLLPLDTKEYYTGQKVTASTTPAKETRVDIDTDTENGYWTFKGWDKSSKTMTDNGVTFTGTWEYTEKKGQAGYYLAIPSASWGTSIPSDITSVDESGKTKYYYARKFEKNDTFTVVSEKPTAEGYYFIGWLDKKRGSQAATIREAGDTVTYIYDNGEKTYTLDALWANVSVPDVKVTYDGKTHTVSEDIGINEGTSLDEKYKNQAKALITTNLTEYSTDNKNWSTEKPVFVDAGEYTVYVRKNVTVGDETTTLTGNGTVKINPATLTVTTNSAEKVYDGTPLTATGSMTGLVTVDGVKETATFTVEGSQTEKGSSKNSYKIVFSDKEVIGGTDTTTTNEENTNNKEANIALTSDGGSTAKSTNYTVSENVGTLTVTAQSLNPKKEDGSDDPAYKGVQVGTLNDVVYNGQSQIQIPTVKTKEGTALTKGTDYTVSYSNDTKNVGTVTVTITGIGNYKGSVTRTYKITPATVIVTTPTASKTYDGTALKAAGSITGLVNKETVTFTTTGSQTEKGTSANTYSLVWDGTAQESNYTVSPTVGTLTVTAKSITPETPEGDKTGIEVSTLDDVKYNGASQQQKPEINDTKTGKTLVEGTDYEVTYSEDTTNAGQVTVTITGIGNYTGEYTVTYNILKRDVTFTSPSASKTYDGSALTSTEIAISGEGFVEGEGASFNVTGTATEVGEVDNTFDYAMNEGTNADNYNVTVVNGKLTITAAPVVPSNDDTTPTTPVVPATTPTRRTTPVTPAQPEVTPTETPEATVEPTATPEATATPEVIDGDETPEVAPKGNWALINLIAAMLSVLLGVIAILAKHKDEEDEEDETEDENVSTRHRRWKIVSAIDAIVAVVAFILTEDITQKMVMVDKWTILMVVIAVVGVVSMYFARKWHEEDEETSEDAQ